MGIYVCVMYIYTHICIYVYAWFPRWLSGKELACQAGDEMRVPSLGWEDPLEEKMAIHSSILAWKIPWTDDPAGLQSIGLQRVGHNLATKPPPPYIQREREWTNYAVKKSHKVYLEGKKQQIYLAEKILYYDLLYHTHVIITKV